VVDDVFQNSTLISLRIQSKDRTKLHLHFSLPTVSFPSHFQHQLTLIQDGIEMDITMMCMDLAVATISMLEAHYIGSDPSFLHILIYNTSHSLPEPGKGIWKMRVYPSDEIFLSKMIQAGQDEQSAGDFWGTIYQPQVFDTLGNCPTWSSMKAKLDSNLKLTRSATIARSKKANWNEQLILPVSKSLMLRGSVLGMELYVVSPSMSAVKLIGFGYCPLAINRSVMRIYYTPQYLVMTKKRNYLNYALEFSSSYLLSPNENDLMSPIGVVDIQVYVKFAILCLNLH
jgi:hypothetical protein